MKRLFLMAWLFLLAGSIAFAQPQVQRQGDGSVRVDAENYRATIDASGHVSFEIAGLSALQHRFLDPRKPNEPPQNVSVNVHSNTVAVRSGSMRIEWTFEHSRVRLVTAGYSFTFRTGDAIDAFQTTKNSGGKYDPKTTATGGVNLLVLSNARVIKFAQPMHLHQQRLFIFNLSEGQEIDLSMELGAPVEAVSLLSGLSATTPGADDSMLKTDGSRGDGLIHFPQGVKPTIHTDQTNASDQPIEMEYRLVVRDYVYEGAVLHEQTQKLSLAPKQKLKVIWELPGLTPGFHYVFISAWFKQQKMTEITVPLTVDLLHYDHALTRPADFEAFWKRHDQRISQTPLNIQKQTLWESGEQSIQQIEFQMLSTRGELKVHRCFMVHSGQPGLLLTAGFVRVIEQNVAEAREGKYKINDWIKSHGTVIWVPMPDDGGFARWDSADDNNMLDCALVIIRSIDMLGALPEGRTGKVKLFGSSRSGPLVLIAAARRPEQVASIDMHVPTSAGISWTDTPYTGWGVFGGYRRQNPELVKKLAAMSAYVDPINHAPDVSAPMATSYGVEDNLSPPNGIEVMYRKSGSAWKRISRDAGGHQYSAGFKVISKEMYQHIQSAGGSGTDERIMKEH